jgi:hypothetical protein
VCTANRTLDPGLRVLECWAGGASPERHRAGCSRHLDLRDRGVRGEHHRLLGRRSKHEPRQHTSRGLRRNQRHRPSTLRPNHHVGQLFGGEWVSDYYTTSPSFNSYAPGLGDCNPAPPSSQVRTQTSPDGLYSLIMQGDGNLVLYAQGSGARWSSGTYSPGAIAWMQGDGNLVVYSQAGAAL